MDDRIRLAEWQGWTLIELQDGTKYWRVPNEKLEGVGQLLPPNPLTDANDCEALIKHLNSKGWEVEVDFNIGAQGVIMWCDDKSQDHYAGQDWKQGVVELAIKVLDSVEALT